MVQAGSVQPVWKTKSREDTDQKPPYRAGPWGRECCLAFTVLLLAGSRAQSFVIKALESRST